MPKPDRPRSSESVIVLDDVSAAYGDSVVLRKVSFSIQRGEIFFIAGNSGGGKSTLLRQMIGLQPISGGTITLLGHKVDLDIADDRKIARLFGVSFQGGALFGGRTIRENVALPLEQFTKLPRKLIGEIALAKLRLVGLEHAAEKLPSELSGGMQKRAAIARAMALDPQIVFLDEPSAGLDPLTSSSLDALIVELNRVLGTTFVVVSHELSSIFAIADRVAIIHADERTVVALDAPEMLRDQSKDPWVQAFFNRDAERANALQSNASKLSTPQPATQEATP
jgi:phospholipid/cholesterol/gamma-HCH transport system ATP-binding protein